MAKKTSSYKRQMGGIHTLSSGSLRIRVYSGIDPVKKTKMYKEETVPAGPDAWEKAEAVRAGFVAEVYQRSEIEPTSEFYELSDQPAPGMTRNRTVLVLKNPDLIVTLDRATSEQDQPFQTQWHLPSDQKVTVSSPRMAVAQKPGDKTKTVLVQVPFQQDLPADAIKVERGKEDPVQGWHYPKATVKKVAPTVLFTREGRSATILSLIVPAATKAAVTYKTAGSARRTSSTSPSAPLTPPSAYSQTAPCPG